MTDSAPVLDKHGQENGRPQRVRFARAGRADDAAIRRLLRDNPMAGAITVSFEREPDYFRGTGMAGAEDDTIVAFEDERLVCFGRCTTRPCWVNGEIRRVGYLGELRLDATARGRFDLVRRGYQFFHENNSSAPAEFYFTSIAADNWTARRLLERGLRTMPRYDFLTELTTLVIPACKVSARHLLELHRAAPGEVTAFLNATGQRGHFGAAWTTEHLSALARHGLASDDFRVVRERGGEIVACAALWDQRSFRQTVIRGYRAPLSLARPLHNLVAPLFRQPRLPAPNSILAHAFISPLAVAPGAEPLLKELLGTLGDAAARRGLDYLTLGFANTDPRLDLVRSQFSARPYGSRLYRVIWPGGSAPVLDARPFQPDVAFL